MKKGKYDERDLMLISKYKSQTLAIIFFEVIIILLLRPFFSFNILNEMELLLFLIIIPLLYFRIRTALSVGVEDSDLFNLCLTAILGTGVMVYLQGNKLLTYLTILPIWLVPIIIWCHERKRE